MDVLGDLQDDLQDVVPTGEAPEKMDIGDAGAPVGDL